MLIRSTLAFALALPALPAQMAGAYLVDPVAPGAFHSFTEAVNAMFIAGVAGPVEIVVAPGTYTESVLVPPLQGASAANTIRFRPLAGPGTVLLGGATGDTFALVAVAFLHTRSIVFDGIDFTGGPGHAISGTTFVEDLEIENCRFASGHRSTAAGEYRHAVIVSENSGNEIGWRVHHNRITLSNHTTHTSYGIYLSNGGDWEVHHNWFELNSADFGVWLINNNRRIDRLYDNLFTGTLQNYGSTYANTVCVIRADLSNYENEITHNTFAVQLPACGSCIATQGYASGSFSAQNYIWGNVFYVLGGTGICVTTYGGSTVPPFQSNGNVFFCPGGELGRVGENVPGATTLAGWQAMSGKDQNSIELDPQLRNPFGTPPDLRPLPGSPVTGVAVLTPSYVTTDYSDRLRDAAPDAGAYESTSFARFGQGCPGVNAQVPQLGSTGAVALGSANFALTLQQAAGGTLAVLMGGLSRTSSTLGTLPLAIGGGCAILVSPDALITALTTGGGAATVAFPIPNTPSLAGFDLFFQWAVVDAASGSSYGIVVSDGGALQF